MEEQEALGFVPNLSWLFQWEFDGRLAVQYAGINKIGQIIPIDAQLAPSLDLVEADSFSWTERSRIRSLHVGHPDSQRMRPAATLLINVIRSVQPE